MLTENTTKPIFDTQNPSLTSMRYYLKHLVKIGNITEEQSKEMDEKMTYYIVDRDKKYSMKMLEYTVQHLKIGEPKKILDYFEDKRINNKMSNPKTNEKK